MKAIVLAIAAVLAAPPVAALADPTGTYSVVGGNPDSGGQYTGTVNVVRTG